MPEIGVRELKTRASEIVRAVRERRAHYLITYRGKPVGMLAALEESERGMVSLPDDGGTAWEELMALGEQIGEGWESDLTAAELLSGMRR